MLNIKKGERNVENNLIYLEKNPFRELTNENGICESLVYNMATIILQPNITKGSILLPVNSKARYMLVSFICYILEFEDVQNQTLPTLARTIIKIHDEGYKKFFENLKKKSPNSLCVKYYIKAMVFT